jgi:hypothetical protein
MLTEQDIVDRAADSAFERWLNIRIAAGIFVGLLIVLAFYEPYHSWLHAHVEFLAGVSAGSLVQSVGWLRDRWRWMKHFSWQ